MAPASSCFPVIGGLLSVTEAVSFHEMTQGRSTGRPFSRLLARGYATCARLAEKRSWHRYCPNVGNSFACCSPQVRCKNTSFCLYRCRNLIQNHAGRSRTGGPKRFGPFSGAFPCGYNSSLRTRFDALTRHCHSSMAVVERPSRSGSN